MINLYGSLVGMNPHSLIKLGKHIKESLSDYVISY